MQHQPTVILLAMIASLASAPFHSARALDYPYATAEPQKTGWPLTDEESKYVLTPEHQRRPGSEQNKYLPAMWPVTPSARFWGGTSWLDTHAKLVETVKANKGPIDILLVGDSITAQWGGQNGAPFNSAWQKSFGQYKTVNIGIGGDKTQNVLWRLDHGGVDGIEPRLAVVLIGNNNMFFTPETGIEPAAKGIKMCAANLREKFPEAPVIVVKVFPAHAPGIAFYEDIKKTNAALDKLHLESDPKVHVLDLTNDMLNPDGTLRQGLFQSDNIHLTQEGSYELYASRLKPLVENLLAGKSVPKSTPKPASAVIPLAVPRPVPPPAGPADPAAISAQPVQDSPAPAEATHVIYNDDIQNGWFNNPINATVTTDNASPIYSGKRSIAVRAAAYGAFQFNHPGSMVDTSPYKSLSFLINGGATGGQKLRVAVLKSGGVEGTRCDLVPIPRANAWRASCDGSCVLSSAVPIPRIGAIEQPTSKNGRR